MTGCRQPIDNMTATSPASTRLMAPRTCSLPSATERRAPCGQPLVCPAANERGDREDATMGVRSAEDTVTRKVAGRRGREYDT